MSTEWKVAVGGEHVSAVYDADESRSLAEPAQRSASDVGLGTTGVFVCAHGAGGSMSDRGMLATAAAYRAAGVGMVRFNFLYKEKKSGRPDPMPKLIETFSAVVAHVRSELSAGKLVIGGRSMGGRAASMMAADGFAADGLLLLAYPLHPAGQPEKLRDAHIPRITMPVLAFSGTRDALCTRSLMEERTGAWDMRWIETADHSFHVLKSSGTTDGEAMKTIATESRRWIDGL